MSFLLLNWKPKQQQQQTRNEFKEINKHVVKCEWAMRNETRDEWMRIANERRKMILILESPDFCALQNSGGSNHHES